jgi:hypothetical protein
MGHLLHKPQANLRLADELAVVGLENTGNDSKERCFSSTVAAYESDFFVGIQLEAGVFKDCLASEALANVIEVDKHGKGDDRNLRGTSGSAVKKKGSRSCPLKNCIAEIAC